MPERDFDMWGGGPGQTNYSTAKNASMKHYAKEYPHSTRSYGAFGRDFILESAKQKTFLFINQFQSSHKPATPDPLDDHIYKDKNLKGRQITDGNLVSTFQSKANRTGSMNGFTRGIILTNTMRLWQSITNKFMPSMLRWE